MDVFGWMTPIPMWSPKDLFSKKPELTEGVAVLSYPIGPSSRTTSISVTWAQIRTSRGTNGQNGCDGNKSSSQTVQSNVPETLPARIQRLAKDCAGRPSPGWVFNRITYCI
jgi:hypothetical protein